MSRRKSSSAIPTETTPPPTRASRGKKKAMLPVERAPVVPNDASDSGVNTIDIKWDQKLTWSLVTAILESADIRRGLFPGPGANASTSNGGGKKKMEFHFDLAAVIFKDHEEYGEDFARVEEAGTKSKVRSSLRKAWAGKIKNKLSTLVAATRKNMAMMRDTGEGLTREELEDLQHTDPDLYNKWQVIEQEFPWYIDMRSLIGNRPNSNPVGIGNSKCGVDDSVLGVRKTSLNSAPGSDEDEFDEIMDAEDEGSREGPSITARLAVDEEELNAPLSIPAALQDDNEAVNLPQKRKNAVGTDGAEGAVDTLGSREQGAATATVAMTKASSHVAKAANSVSSKAGAAKKSKAETKAAKKLKYIEDFVEIALEEERTKQKTIELKRADREFELEKLRLKNATKTEAMRLKLELEKAKLQAATEIRLAKLRSQHNETAPVTGMHAGSSQAQAGPSSEPYTSVGRTGTNGNWHRDAPADRVWNFETSNEPALLPNGINLNFIPEGGFDKVMELDPMRPSEEEQGSRSSHV